MVTETDLRACAKEFNKVMGLDPPINLNKDLETLIEEIQQGIELIKADDEFNEQATNVIKAFKDSTEDNPVTVVPDEKPPVTTNDLSEMVKQTHNFDSLKEIVIQNIEFKSIRKDIDSFITVEDLKDRMFELLVAMKFKGEEPVKKKLIKVRPTEPVIPEEDDIPPEEKEEIPPLLFPDDDLAKINDIMPSSPFELNVNERFRIACPPLAENEFKALEELIVRDGIIHQPILTWHGFIVDGHNRYAIALKNSIPFITQEKDFESEEDVIIWIKENAISQRNLSDFAKIELIAEIETILKSVGKEKMALKSLSPKKNSHNTRQLIAEKIGVSEGQISKAKIIEESADEETKDKLRKGELKIGTVHKELKEKKEPVFSYKRAAKNLEKWARKYSEEDKLQEFVTQVLDIVDQIRKMK
jgi:hypothetical protein